MIKIILVLAISALVSGCATEARISEYQMCAVQGREKFPVQSVPQNYTEIEYFQRQEGMTCTRIPSGFYNAGGMECEPNMRTYQRQVQKTRYVDANAGSRNSWIEQCANQQCIRKFGNSDCEKVESKEKYSNNSINPNDFKLDKSQLERYKKEVQSGNSSAQFNLALMYMYGQGVVQDNSRAYMWLQFSEENGNSNSHRIRHSLLDKMSSEEKAKSKKMIAQCRLNFYKNCE